jgi:hypothetical protein
MESVPKNGLQERIDLHVLLCPNGKGLYSATSQAFSTMEQESVNLEEK